MEEEALKREKEASTKLAEERAVARALETRKDLISEFEKTIKGRESSRISKMEALEAKYKLAVEKRSKDLNENKDSLPPDAFSLYKVKIHIYTYYTAKITLN
jgi:hypothetical protein